MRNLNLDQIQTLIAIADLGTFAAASQRCIWRRPRSACTSRNWRRACRFRWCCGRRQAGLTAAGQALVEEGRKLLAASDDLVDIVRRRAAGSVGVVKVGVSAGVGIRLLPLVLEAGAARARRGRETGSGGFG